MLGILIDRNIERCFLFWYVLVVMVKVRLPAPNARELVQYLPNAMNARERGNSQLKREFLSATFVTAKEWLPSSASNASVVAKSSVRHAAERAAEKKR